MQRWLDNVNRSRMPSSSVIDNDSERYSPTLCKIDTQKRLQPTFRMINIFIVYFIHKMEISHCLDGVLLFAAIQAQGQCKKMKNKNKSDNSKQTK